MLTVRTNDLEIAYRTSGDGEPVVLINGTGESGATWEFYLDALGQRYRCVAIDNRDTGDSSYVTAGYTARDMAMDVAGVITELDLGPCHVVGYSLGGATAQELALAKPDLVRSLVLLSTWAASDGWFAAQMRNWQSIRRAHWDDEDAFLAALAPWLFAPATFAVDGKIDAIYAHADAIETRQRPEGWIRQCDADIAHDAGARLGAISQPSLVLVGEDDICTPPRYARELCGLIEHAELVSVPQAAHCALFERPGRVASAVEDFLTRH
ncbi:MAG TPA: alpha/beta hydrolase [Actinomycetota bacterium]|nr:alpha/beta hydrolase [Actinomycetota bacterium]